MNGHLTPVTHPAIPIKAAPGQMSVAEIMHARHAIGMLPKVSTSAVSVCLCVRACVRACVFV